MRQVSKVRTSKFISIIFVRNVAIKQKDDDNIPNKTGLKAEGCV